MRPSLAALLLAPLLMATASALAQEPVQEFVEVPPPPPMPATSEDDDEEMVDDELEPEVTIINRKDATYEEYRLNGRLYMVKVTPAAGPPYYFVDRDGDGLMETRMNNRASAEIRVPQWVILSW